MADAAEPLGFGVRAVVSDWRRVPGEQRNERWHEAVLLCPCGNPKTIHIKNTSLPHLAEERVDHLKRDGLIPHEDAQRSTGGS